MEELLSPVVTPFILCFWLRHKSADIIDFYHKFTVDVTGVGDVCSFAQMDVQKHGNPQVNCLKSVFCSSLWLLFTLSEMEQYSAKRCVHL